MEKISNKYGGFRRSDIDTYLSIDNKERRIKQKALTSVRVIVDMERPIQIQDLDDYVQRYEDYPDNIRKCDSNDMVYEALCESIVEVNTDFDVDSIGQRFNLDAEDDARKFVMSEFNRVIDDELWTEDIINLVHKNNWIESVLLSFDENGYSLS